MRGGATLTATPRQTNNVAEIQAAVVAVRQAVTAGRDKLLIHTDSEYLINCVTKWMQGWKVGGSAGGFVTLSQKKGWKTASGQVAKNKDDLEKLDKLILANKGLVIRWGLLLSGPRAYVCGQVEPRAGPLQHPGERGRGPAGGRRGQQGGGAAGGRLQVVTPYLVDFQYTLSIY